jgi:hypothetical protein
MASVLHGSARATPRIRAELQASNDRARALAARYGLNAKTVCKWRKRTTTADAPMVQDAEEHGADAGRGSRTALRPSAYSTTGVRSARSSRRPTGSSAWSTVGRGETGKLGQAM